MKRNVVEWSVLISSVVAIAVLVVVLIVGGVTNDEPANPSIVVHAAQARPGSAGWIVPATVANSGGQVAEGVVFEATAQVDGEPETSEIEVPYLPAGSSVELAFVFSANPAGPIESRLVGFRLP